MFAGFEFGDRLLKQNGTGIIVVLHTVGVVVRDEHEQERVEACLGQLPADGRVLVLHVDEAIVLQLGGR